MPTMKKACIPSNLCVACGRCLKVCPKKALSICKGIYAIVNQDCVGCGKCEKVCPAGIISMVQKERIGTVNE